MRFALPSLLALALLAPIAALCAHWIWRRRRAAESAWTSPRLAARQAPPKDRPRIALSVAMLSLAILGIALALSRPRWGTSQQTVERKGIDIVFVLDSSLSMAAFDVAPNRLAAGKSTLRRVAAELAGDRVGLVQAEGGGVVLCPLTLDAGAIDLLLDGIEPASLPTPGTELAPALEVAARLFPPGEDAHRAIVLVTDGEDHGRGLDEVARRLSEVGISVFAFGVGTLEGGPLPLAAETRVGPSQSLRAEQLDAAERFKRDRKGQVVISRLREEALETLAQTTGGAYLRVASVATDPKPMIAAISKLPTRTIESLEVTALEERFQWPLALAALALLTHLAVRPFRAAPRPAAAEGNR